MKASVPRSRVRPATPAALAIDTIQDAFRRDPVARWIWPEEDNFEDAMPRFTEAFGRHAFSSGSADLIGQGWGAALWLPPGKGPDEEAVIKILNESVISERHSEIFGMFEQMDQLHPTEPHWYLSLIGIREQYQSRGYGSSLMLHALDRCDADGLPAYLEATNSRNVQFYESFGFQNIGKIQSGTSPELYSMLRPARPSS